MVAEGADIKRCSWERSSGTTGYGMRDSHAFIPKNEN
jgi:hypothetical protein